MVLTCPGILQTEQQRLIQHLEVYHKSMVLTCQGILQTEQQRLDTTSRSISQVNGTDVSRNTANGTTTSDTTSRSISQVNGTDVSRNTANGTTTSDTISRSMSKITGTAVSRYKRTPLEITTQSDQQTSTYPNMLEDECFSFGGCKLPEYFIDSYCYCDTKCNDYKDCCAKHNLITNIAQDRYECIRINTEENKKKGFQTISMCSLEYHDNTIKEKCKEDNMIENGPPVVDYRNVDIFKNMYCAICNNVTDYFPFGIKFYNAKIIAEEMDQFQNLTKKSKLSLLFTDADYELIPPPGLELRTCVAEMIENSHPLCKKYVNPILQIDGRRVDVFRNSFCISRNERQHQFYCFRPFLNIIWANNDVRSLSVIFSFREPKSYVDDVNFCKEWSIEVERSGMCAHLETYLNFDKHLVYYVISTKNHTEKELIRIGLVSVLPLSVTNFTQFAGKLVIKASENKTMLKVDVTLKVLKKVFYHEKQLIENSFYERKTTIIIRGNATESIVQVENRKDIASTGNQPVQFYSLYSIKFVTAEPYPLFLIKLEQNDINTDANIDKFCIDEQVTVDVMPDGSFDIDADNVRCHMTHVIGYDKTSSNWSVSEIMTYICFSVSIISLVVLIVFNRKKDLYASIPGSNLENLSISLLLSNLLFLLGIGASSLPRLCYVVGVTLHFLWLTVFAFMSIAVVYIMSNLLAIKSRREISKRDLAHKRRHMTVIGILIPLLIVVPGIVIDLTGPENWSLGYGGAVCFPNRYPSNVVLFSGPVVLSVGIDFVCLTYIIFQICRLRLELRHIRKLNLYKDAQIYLRVVALSGVFWTTGIISAIYELQWLDFLFTILCGLQGFFVAVANINTSRVQSLKAESTQKNSTDTKT
ncbi:unnamed protein product [Mytilus edulis]|uniref:G-protein coupled receptors family 2 profile 2 domain-containing protein n=1 Tax=Mytilus edulis TaxID=6550 RepID=A0A8S3PXG6_MYTED|nr:unnamed protein product [Mytilus edulis]